MCAAELPAWSRLRLSFGNSLPFRHAKEKAGVCQPFGALYFLVSENDHSGTNFSIFFLCIP